MKTEVTFRSERFRPYLPEACQVNPGRYGAELAYWLSRELAGRGVVTSYPNFEDWGWFLEYITDSGEEYWLCCGNEEDSADDWVCFLEPKGRGLFGHKKAVPEHAAPLMEALDQVLEAEPGVGDLAWSEPPGGPD